MTEKLKQLEKEYGFIIEKDNNPGILHLLFNDGKQYKYQKPTFMTTYGRLMNTDNFQLDLLKMGLENLFPENEKSPKIDEDYLNANSEEGWGLWSVFFRELL